MTSNGSHDDAAAGVADLRRRLVGARDADVGVPHRRRRHRLRLRADRGDGLAAQLRDEVPARRVGRHRVLELPAEQAGVEARRRPPDRAGSCRPSRARRGCIGLARAWLFLSWLRLPDDTRANRGQVLSSIRRISTSRTTSVSRLACGSQRKLRVAKIVALQLAGLAEGPSSDIAIELKPEIDGGRVAAASAAAVCPAVTVSAAAGATPWDGPFPRPWSSGSQLPGGVRGLGDHRRIQCSETNHYR